MAGLKITAFAGFVPRQSPYLLQDNEAQIAKNTKLYSNELRPWQRPGVVDGAPLIPFVPLTIYRGLKTSGDNLWLAWEDDVDVVPGPVFDVGNPLYYTGDGVPKKTNSALAETGTGPFPGDYLLMGVPTPTTAPTVAASGGSGATESRVYLYTFISEFGQIIEESAPSPASALVNVLSGGTVTVSGLPATAPTGKYNITKIRIYRSVAGANSNPFLKVADVNIGTTSYADNLSATQLGGVLPSSGWTPPPDDLRGLVGMANGIMAGFRNNEVWFSEPFIPHAWPAQYSLTVEFPIVGLAAVGTSLVVMTRGNPFIITGSNPAAMTQEKLPLYEPCVSKRSIATDEGGALYASPNGVIRIGPGVADNVSRNLFTRDEWSNYNPFTMLGEVQDGRYFVFYENESTSGGLIFDRNSAASPLTSTSFYATAAHSDVANARLFLAENSNIRAWDSDVYNGLPFEWRSKVFVFPRPLNFGAGQIDADFENRYSAFSKFEQFVEFVKEQNAKVWESVSNLLGAINETPLNDKTSMLNGSLLAPIPQIEERYILLSVYADGKLRAKIQVKNRQPFRLPSGFKADNWEFQIDGNVSVRYLKVAETSKELAAI